MALIVYVEALTPKVIVFGIKKELRLNEVMSVDSDPKGLNQCHCKKRHQRAHPPSLFPFIM